MSSPPKDFEPTPELLAALPFSFNERQEVTRRGERIPVSKWVRQLVYRRDNWQCKICGACPFAAALGRRTGPLQLDHIIPWSAGGSDRTDNLRTLCQQCNERRSNTMGPRDRAATPIIRACVVCLGQGRFVRDDVPNAIDAWCATCQSVSFTFPSAQIL